MRNATTFLLLFAAAAAIGCERPAGAHVEPAASAEPASLPALALPSTSPSPAPAPAAPSSPAPVPLPDTLTLLAGGDVCLGRGVGQALLRDPAHDPFASVTTLLASADVRFVNLESQLSDQGGETQHPRMPLVFTGPPAGAGALARAGIGVVSVANNHMWDYGQRAFFETLEHLERAGVAYAGAGATPARANAPAIVEHRGFRVAVLAVTDIWNQGSLWDHPARLHVAAANLWGLSAAVRAARARPGVDAVIVSYHGGVEYLDMPLPRTRDIARAAIDAGAHVFLGHHPHVLQGIELYRGRPIFYSLGNFVMKMSHRRPETEIGMLARLALRRGAPPSAEVCPVRSEGLGALPLATDPRRAATEAEFLEKIRAANAHLASPPALGPFAPDGCAPLAPAAAPAR